MSDIIDEVFYSEEHEELDQHLQVVYDKDKQTYQVSGLTGENSIELEEDDLEGDSSLDAFQNAYEKRKNEGSSGNKGSSDWELGTEPLF